MSCLRVAILGPIVGDKMRDHTLAVSYFDWTFAREHVVRRLVEALDAAMAVQGEAERRERFAAGPVGVLP